MKPIVLSTGSLAKHDAALGNLLGRDDADELVAVEIVQNEFLWPRREKHRIDADEWGRRRSHHLNI